MGCVQCGESFWNDLQTRRQTELAKGAAVVDPYWSHDSREVFFQDVREGSNEPIYRVRIDNL